MILRKKYKKPLVFTKRVWRIYSVATMLSLAVFALFLILAIRGVCDDWWYRESRVAVPVGILLLMTIFSWAIVIASVTILSPVEKTINRRYWIDARRLLKSMPDMKIIGITGSYGKTSTKHYLHRILSEQYDVLMTPGSYNTPMGVIRTVREQLRPNHKIFICEMGAKQTGDIKEICDLVNPQMGIITAVGPMHLESFKTIQNVQATKFELADAIPSDGFVVINNDSEYCANRSVNNTEALRYSVNENPESAYFARDIKYSPEGTTFYVEGPGGYSLQLSTSLVGECNIANLLAAVVMAHRLDVPDDKIRYAVSRIEQVEHRLNIKRTPGGVTVIDDAFNSNPEGSRMAVDVLSSFTGGNRIIVTPGMIELGDKQYEHNKSLGAYIAGKVDLAIIVGEYNRTALTDGLKSNDMPAENVVIVDTFTEAQNHLATILKSGDTVLYENDLPDTFK